MTEKRYSDGTLAKWYYSQTNVISDGNNEYYLRNKESVKDWGYNELLGTNDLLDELNKLSDENEQLKKELQRMYDVATLNKAIEVLENKYDKMLSDGSDEVKDAMRHTVLRCIEDLDELKDDLTAR